MRLTKEIDGQPGRYAAGIKKDGGKYGMQECLDKLGQLEDAENDGRLIVLPVKVGVKVYAAEGDGVVEYETIGFHVGTNLDVKIKLSKDIGGGHWVYYRDVAAEDVGKDVFLSEEEVKEKLRRNQRGI